MLLHYYFLDEQDVTKNFSLKYSYSKETKTEDVLIEKTNVSIILCKQNIFTAL